MHQLEVDPLGVRDGQAHAVTGATLVSERLRHRHRQASLVHCLPRSTRGTAAAPSI
jgi:hypothetical protein